MTQCTLHWTPVPVWTDAESLATTVIRSPAHPVRSESLYRLRYPGLIQTFIAETLEIITCHVKET